MRLLSFIKSLLAHPVLTIESLLYPPDKQSNYNRWKNMESLASDWDERTIIIATLIPPGSDVLEFGAGRLVLRDHLPKNCTYQPSDIVDRGENTIICDLNDTFPILEKNIAISYFQGFWNI